MKDCCLTTHTHTHTHTYIYIYIYTPSQGLSTLAKISTVATRVMPNSSNELSSSVSDSIKCEQKKVNTYKLNSLSGYEAMLSVCRKVSRVLNPA